MDRVRAEYRDRLRAQGAAKRSMERERAVFWWLRAAALASLVPILGMASEGRLPSSWLAAPISGVALTSLLEHRFRSRRDKASRAAAFYRARLDHLDGLWTTGGFTGEDLVRESHPYANDLDIVGRRAARLRPSP